MEQVKQRRFSYADYEAAIRGPFYPRLREISAETAARFQGCSSVLDIASGQGFLLDALRDLAIPAVGVDNEPHLVQTCRSRGLNVVEQDVLEFLTTSSERFDGAYCGHLIEHLPYEAMLDLIEGVQKAVRPGGIFIVRWPNPRSGQTVFYSYWKDPTHIRFYDGDFIQAVLAFYGFDIIEYHYDTLQPIVKTETFGEEAVRTEASVQADSPAAAGSTPLAPPSSGNRKIGWQFGALGRRLLGGPLRINELSRRVGDAEAAQCDLQRQLHDLQYRHQYLSDRTEDAKLVFGLPAEVYIIARRGSDDGV